MLNRCLCIIILCLIIYIILLPPSLDFSSTRRRKSKTFKGQHTEELPDKKIIKFNAAHDRLGSMAIRLINLLTNNIYSNNEGLFDISVKYAYNSHTDYTKTVLFKMVMKTPNVRLYKKGDKYDIDVGFYQELGSNTTHKKYKTDLSTIFQRTGMKRIWYNTLVDEAKERKWILPQKPYVVIHTRLDDLKHWTHKSGGKVLHRKLTDEEFTNSIKKMKKLYPNYPLYIMTTPHDKDYVASMLRNHSLTKSVEGILGSDNMEKDIWIMANSEVLVTSFSCFAIFAAMLHQGSQVYCFPFAHLEDLGIFKDYDRSGWKKI